MKKFYYFLGFAALVAFAFFSYKGSGKDAVEISRVSEDVKSYEEYDTISTSHTANDYVEAIKSGGVPKDGIPPIEKPVYVDSIEAARFMDDDDKVFFFEEGDTVKVFPQKILVWHEIVNDTKNDKNIALSYCPLTGSAIGYYCDGTSLGVSGKLLNSNLVMYDRKTDSYWPQILGQAILGQEVGNELETFMVNWSNWKKVRENYENIQVLSDDTGYIRSYGSDPYGSYSDQRSYYYNEAVFFDLMNEDFRLSNKEVVIGIFVGEKRLAVRLKDVKEKKVINTDLDGMSLVLIYDEKLDTVRVFKSEVDGVKAVFSYEGGNIKDDVDGRIWKVNGMSESGDSLEWVKSFDVMWFSWVAYFPETELYAGR